MPFVCMYMYDHLKCNDHVAWAAHFSLKLTLLIIVDGSLIITDYRNMAYL